MANLPPALRDWAIEPRDASILASLLNKLLDTDRNKEAENPEWVGVSPLEAADRKTTWIDHWENTVRAGLVLLISDTRPKIFSDTMPEFTMSMAALAAQGNRHRAGILLLELASADGYWPCRSSDTDFKSVRIHKTIRADVLQYASEKLGFPRDFGGHLRSALEADLQELASRVGFKSQNEFEGWSIPLLTQGICAPFLRGGLKVGQNGGSSVSAKRDQVASAIGHLSSGMIMTGDVGMPLPPMILGAGSGLLLAPGLTGVLPPVGLVQPESILCAVAKYRVYLTDVMKLVRHEAIVCEELIQLLRKNRDQYRQVADAAFRGALSAHSIDTLFDMLEEVTRRRAAS